MTTAADLREVFTDPVRFQETILLRKLWHEQHAIARAVVGPIPVAIKGCHASGKTYDLAGCALHHLTNWTDGKVFTIAPTMRQVKLIWEEIARAAKGAKVAYPEPTTAALRINSDRYGLGFSASRGVNAQGFHGGHVLIITDESPGIPAEVWDAIEGVRAGGVVQIAMAGNPVVPSGAYFEAFTKHAGEWNCRTISAFDTPNLAGVSIEQLMTADDDFLGVVKVHGLVTRRWVRDRYRQWGPNSPRYISRVLAQFPTQATDSVFHLAWIERAGHPIDDEKFTADLKALHLAGRRPFIQVGLDIAGPGDDETSVYARIGTYVIGHQSWSKPDPLDEVLAFIARIRARFPGVPMAVMADVVGIGYHFARAVARRVVEIQGGFQVFEFNAGGAPVDQVMFANAKAEAYWRTREALRAGEVTGIEDEDTKAQLSDVRYRELPNGRIEIEHKDEARARGSSSPDRAEALIMAFAAIVPRVQEVYSAGYQETSAF